MSEHNQRGSANQRRGQSHVTVGPVPHEHCGVPVLLAHLSASSKQKTNWVRDTLTLEPDPTPGRGNVTINAGQAAVVRPGTGDYWVHRCPNKVSRCKYCLQPVRVLYRPFDGHHDRLMVVNADPHPRGVVVVNEDGHAVRDVDFELPGVRYLWHTKH